MVTQPGDARRRRKPRWWAALIPVVVLTLALPTAPAVAADPPPGEDFTLAVIPDTQGYTVSTTHESKLSDQVNWIVENRDDLNIAWVTQVGDLVESWPNVNQWARADKYLKVLDDASVPNSVLPGNHDMDIVAGESSTFDTYFPPTRYSTAAWNSTTASYGGYLGQNLFGPDPVDRKNKDSFGLFTAGGLEFVLINLEFESPDYTLDWAKKVLNAYPDRRAIISTHGFINTAGTRSNAVIRSDPGVNSAVQVWNELIYDNCNIFLVLNGHWHDGDEGEANRTDPNACGKPVHQILSNYQERINGGNGWMRYYQFSPAGNTITARTWSPTLGVFETDADSAFSLPYDMSSTSSSEEILVRGSSTWAWWYQNSSWPAGWSSPTFADGSWARGPAVLGFGANGAATNIDAPAPTTNRGRSALFRHRFTVADAAQLSGVSLTTRADDGIVVSVNGVEVGRKNMPAGAVSSGSYATLAPSTSAATAAPAVFTVPPALLRDGENVITASVHVNYRATSDLSFDAIVTALRHHGEPVPQPPTPPSVTGTAVGSTSARVDWVPGSGPEPVSYRISRDGAIVTTVPEPTRTFTDPNLSPGSTYTYSVTAVGATGLQSPAGTASVTLPPAGSPTPTTLVATGSTWRWLSSSAGWPIGWTGTAFTDGTWAAGPGPLGFGSAGIATNIDVPPPTTNRPRTTLLRHTFTLSTASEYSALSVRTRADDGVAVWVNGTEVGRKNLPTGTLTTNSYATAAPSTSASTADPAVFTVPPALLRNGVNVVAMSMHLNYRGTPDASVDLSLTGTRTSGTPTQQQPPAAPTVTATATGPTAVDVSWTPNAGAAPASYRVLRNGSEIRTVSEPTRSISDSGLAPATTYRYTVLAVGSTGLASAEGSATVTTPQPQPTAEPIVLVPAGSAWTWLYSASPWPTGWASTTYDDGAWATGSAPFGFGFSGVATNIDVPAPTTNRPRSALFRTAFSLAGVTELSGLSVTSRADDGIVVWVNGVEIGRSNLSTGPVGSTSYATAAPRTSTAVANPVTFPIPATLLVEGRNVITASVHLNYRGTADVSFDLAATGTRTPAAG